MDDIEWWLEECGIYEGERWSVVEMAESFRVCHIYDYR